ncbi:MAG: transcription antitermination factor NusB [Acetatifactor sp.]|nr:transcription antitermination factor NusB [Acetatifactor sp.]
MGRHELREQIFLFLFCAEFHDVKEMPRQARLFLENTDTVITQAESEVIETKASLVLAKLPEIDRLINENTEGWDTTRMGKVELTTLRLAVYELRFDEEIPAGVAINEAVEIAKKYGTENSGGFVNAILGKIAKLEV